jgi:hypothetical protein
MLTGVFISAACDMQAVQHRMKLALLGCDEEALELVRCAVAGGNHVLTAAFDAAAYVRQLKALAPQVRCDDQWESLLLGTVADAVIVARGRLDLSLETGFSASERRDDQLRKLAQAAVPMLVVHPACEMIVGYEVEMIRAASGGVILPYVSELFHPAVAELRSLGGSSSPLGDIEQVIFERHMTDRSRTAVATRFLRDASLLRRLLGTIRQVAASGPAGTEYHDPLAGRTAAPPSLASLSVHLSGERPYPARWSVEPVDDLAGARLVLVGARGRATLHLADDPVANWVLDVTAAPHQALEFPPFNAPLDALSRLQAALEQDEPPEVSWIDACRDLEAASAIDRSLEKGRAIALYTEEITEEQSFKGVMAVAGCLTLAVTMLGVVIVVLVEALQLELRRSSFWRLWPVFLLTPILVFLVLQTLGIVARGSGKKGRRTSDSENSSSPDGGNRQQLPMA